MVAPDNPNIARVTWQMHRGTRVHENTFHLYRSAGWTYAQLVAALDAAYTLWHTYAQPIIPAGIGLYNIHGQVYDPNGAPWVADRAVSPEEAGAVLGDIEPGNVTSTLSIRAPYAGRAYRGRIYWPGYINTETNTDDTLTSAKLAALVTFVGAWLTAFNSPTGTGQLVIFHRGDNLFSTVTAVVLDKILDSMRRRLPARGV